MASFRPLPPAEFVRERLDYDPVTGIFRWKVSASRVNIGDQAGSHARKYILIGMRWYGQLFAHRLAWLHFYGKAPAGEIDHIDGNPANNAIANLREATSSQQKMNKRVQSNNRSGLKGAYFHACRTGKQWRSQIKVGRRLIFLGYFDTAEQAHDAYTAASKVHFAEFSPIAFAESSAAMCADNAGRGY